MSDGVTVKFKGLKKLKKELGIRVKLTDDETARILIDAGTTAQKVAKQRAPYMTGNLRRSIQLELRGTPTKKVLVNTDTVYAAAQEFGTQRTRPKLFMTAGGTAAEKTIASGLKAFKRKMERA